MKTFLKLTFSALLLTTGMAVSSPVPPTDGELSEKKVFAAAMFPNADHSKIWLCLEKYKATDKVTVELLDEQGQLMFSEVLPMGRSKNKAYRQPFDLSQINDGQYTFRITSGIQTEKMTFNLKTPVLEKQQPARLISLKN